MNKYHIEFFYGSDMRCDANVEAQNELSALVKALENSNIDRWADEKGFRVVINAA